MTARICAVSSALLSAAAILSLAIPLYVIRPFRPQGASELAVALAVRAWSPWIAGVGALFALVLLLVAWPRLRNPSRLALLLMLMFAGVSAAATHVNLFEQMFHPYPQPAFVKASDAAIDRDDKVLSATINGETHAFPIRAIGYHHIVNDTIGGVPIAATYCTLCHTGLIYDRRLGGRTLTFVLAGINNGNALLRDRETGTVWQQSTGEAIFGPLKGQRLTLIPADELTFATWSAENPTGKVLAADASHASLYDPKDWESRILKTHVVVDTSATGVGAHTLMLGIVRGASSKAFPVETLLDARVMEDRVGDEAIVIVAAPDGASLRAFLLPRTQTGEATPMHFIAATDAAPGAVMQDRESGSAWDFKGCAVAGSMRGQCLPPVEAHRTFWFDWVQHHPDSRIFHG